MARNRKRAKERRARRGPGSPVATRPRSELQFTPGGALEPAGGEPLEQPPGAPDPIEHAAPDAELAEAQLALGRPDMADEGDSPLVDEPAGELDEDGEYAVGEQADERAARPRGRARRRQEEPGTAPAETLPAERSAAGAPAARVSTGARLTGFLEGSWRELQRVQWPDRRQVMQATGVVIGFVIVAGAFLGVADWAAQHVVNLVLYGHF